MRNIELITTVVIKLLLTKWHITDLGHSILLQYKYWLLCSEFQSLRAKLSKGGHLAPLTFQFNGN
jgi:hypothetical protein